MHRKVLYIPRKVRKHIAQQRGAQLSYIPCKVGKHIAQRRHAHSSIVHSPRPSVDACAHTRAAGTAKAPFTVGLCWVTHDLAAAPFFRTTSRQTFARPPAHLAATPWAFRLPASARTRRVYPNLSFLFLLTSPLPLPSPSLVSSTRLSSAFLSSPVLLSPLLCSAFPPPIETAPLSSPLLPALRSKLRRL